MKKVVSNIFVALALMIICSGSSFAAFDPGDAINRGVNMVTEPINNAQTQIDGVKAKINKAISTAKEKYEMAKKKIKDGIASALDKLKSKEDKAKPISTMKTVKNSNKLPDEKQKDPEAVSKVIQELFMAYPTNEPIVMAAYRRKADEFWVDTLMEMYVVSHSFDEEVKAIEDAIEELSNADNLTGSDSSGGDGEKADDTKALISAYDALSTFNDLAKLAETLATLRAQYKAVRYIRYYVIPAEFKGEGGKSSSLVLKQKVYANAKESFDWNFAAFELRKSEKTLADKASVNAQKTNIASDQKEIDSKALKKDLAVDANSKERNKNTFRERVASDATKLTEKAKIDKAEKANKVMSVGEKSAGANISNKPLANATIKENLSETAVANDDWTKAKSSLSNKSAAKSEAVKTTAEVKNENLKMLTKSTANTPKASSGTSKGPQPFGGYVYDFDANSTLKFSKSADPDLQSPFSGAEEEFEMMKKMQDAYDIMTKAINVHNIKQALPSYKNTFDSYHDIVYQHVMAITNVKQADQCAINFLSNYYKNAEHVWYGASRLSNPTDYESRSGISGWAYKSFQAGKVLVADNEMVSADDMGSTDYEMKEDEGSNIDSIQGGAEKMYSDKYAEQEDSKEGTEDEDDDNEKGTLPGIASQTDAARIKQNLRLREKFTFLIGSEITQALAADQYGAQQWGKPYRKFSLWNDQKNFYDLYLEKKYENMRDYMENISYLDFLMEMVNLTSYKYTNEDEEVQEAVRTELRKNYQYYKSHKMEITSKLDAANELKQLVEKRKEVLASMQEDYNKQKSSITEAIERTKVTLDGVLENINLMQEKIDTQEKTIRDAKAQVSQAEKDEVEGKKRLEETKGKTSGFLQLAALTKVQQKAEKVKAETELKASKLQMKALRSRQEALEKEIQNKKKALIELADKFEEEYLAREKMYETLITNARENKKVNEKDYTTLNIYIKYLNRRNELVKDLLRNIDGDVLRCIKTYTIKQINDAEAKVANLGDNKYSQKGAKEIENIHKKMMDKFKPETKDLIELAECKNLKSYYLSGIVEVIKSALYNKICEDSKCLIPDEEYFVGVAPVERDFKAAHKMAEIALPPVRELIYFDNEEFTGLQKKNRLVGFTIYKKINRKEAVSHFTYEKTVNNKVYRIPEIWEKMLDPHSYVEVGYDLSKIEAKGAEAKAAANSYMRGGIYPCKLANNLYLDVETNEGRNVIFNFSSRKPGGIYNINVPECQELGAILVKKPRRWFDVSAGGMVQNYDIQMKDGRAYLIYDKVYTDASWSGHEIIRELSEDQMQANTANGSSELAMLVSYIEPTPPVIPSRVKDGLVVVAQTPTTVFKRMKKEDEADKNGKTSFYAAHNYRTQMNRNQIGDFLTMVENEQILSQGESELRERIKSLRETLTANLKTAGIEVSPEIDLSDTGQYLSLSQKLDNAKSRLVAQLSNEVIKLTMELNKDNELLDEKMKKLNAVRKALLQDVDTLLVISENSDGGSAEFAAELITAKVNQKATDKYDEEANNNKVSKVAPYCAAYPVF